MKHGNDVRTLASSLISEGSSTRSMYVLHGIFGSGRNWSSVMRRFVRHRPDWSCRLIDLRQHGDSQEFAPPHTIAAAAADLAALAQAENETPSAVLGHSFGGKVALAYARDHGDALAYAWIIDSTPEARVPDGSAWQMLELLRRMPREFASRDELIDLLTRFGVARPTAQWMATNLQTANGSYRWRFDLDAIEALLRDFFERDLWSAVEQPRAGLELHFVKAEASSVLSPAAVQRIEKLARDRPVFLHGVPGGHWVNVENPDALLALLTSRL